MLSVTARRSNVAVEWDVSFILPKSVCMARSKDLKSNEMDQTP